MRKIGYAASRQAGRQRPPHCPALSLNQLAFLSLPSVPPSPTSFSFSSHPKMSVSLLSIFKSLSLPSSVPVGYLSPSFPCFGLCAHASLSFSSLWKHACMLPISLPALLLCLPGSSLVCLFSRLPGLGARRLHFQSRHYINELHGRSHIISHL